MKFPVKPGGYTVKDRLTEHFRIDESLYPPLLKQPRHAHTFASFSYVASGNYLEKFGKRAHSRQPWTVTFHPPNESHSVDFGSNVRILSVHFSFEKLARIQEQSVVLDAPMNCRTETVAWLGTRLRQELRQTDAVSGLAIEGLILEMLAEAERSKISGEKGVPQWLKEAKNFLHDNFASSLTLETVARVAGVHPAHLSRVFRAKFGCTVGEYVRRLRVEYACRQITTTEMSLGEIAFHAGFSDQSHFNKIFKNLYNLTPYEYRKNSRPR